jgi:hypothetical protein
VRHAYFSGTRQIDEGATTTRVTVNESLRTQVDLRAANTFT